MAQKRKATDRLSIEDATNAADRQRQHFVPYVPKSGLPIEMQLTIWAPIVKEMNVLDLLDLSWTPSWGVEGVRVLLNQDDMWTFFWDRDFRKTGLCKDIPMRIPEFLLEDDGERGPIDAGDQVFINLPWRRYYIWTHYSLRSLSRVIVSRVNKDVFDFHDAHLRGSVNPSIDNIPFGVEVKFKFTQLEVKHRTVTDLTVADISDSWVHEQAEDYPNTINEVIMAHVESRLSHAVPTGGTWVASQLFWETESDWSLPVYAARYIITMGIQDLRAIPATNRRIWPLVRIPNWGRKFIIRWLIWCLRNTDGLRYDFPGANGVERQGVTVKHVLEWMSEDLIKVLIQDSLSQVHTPIVPRRQGTHNGGPRRNRLFLGEDVEDNKICFNCGEEGATKRCMRCKGAIYCSKECQINHWHSEHKNNCE